MQRFTKVLVLLALVLAGCGGGAAKHPTAVPFKVSTPFGVKACSPANYVMQCGLRTPKASTSPRLPSPPGSTSVAQGVDFAWGGPSCATARSHGWQFGASYLSYDSTKDWSSAQFHDYATNGCHAVTVFETGSTEATAGYNAGYSDATHALARYRLYVPSGRVAITFAIDCDCSGAQVRSYFEGADAYLWPRAGRESVNAYGGYYPVSYLCNAGLVGHLNWQTYAWSGGNWASASCAPLEQYLNDTSVDYDRALAPDYGQYPPPAPPAPPRTHCFGKQAQLANPTCKHIRPLVAQWSRARDSSLRALDRRRCLYSGIVGGNATPLFHSRSDCDVLKQRAGYFAQQVIANLY